MRLASFLPMLLLAFSIPIAAQNCQIFDLTATVVQANPLTCEFFISLNFQHDGTTNQYTVSGNGNNYGTFPYSQVPVVLGPFTASPTGPTPLEFLVKDVEFPDCKDVTDLVIPACVPPCSIVDLQVDPGQCDPLGLTYSLFVNFQVQGNQAIGFTVWANGNPIGNFPVAGLPLLLPAFPASGNPTDEIKICINNQPDCCEILTFDAPNCIDPPCGIFDLSVLTGDCFSDSTYKIKIDFDALGPALADSFGLWSNGHFIGLFGLNQLPLTQLVKWNVGPKDEIKVCVGSAVNNCCKTLDYSIPDCLHFNPCGILDLVVKPDTCTSDSTFHATLNFAVSDPSQVDSFDLWANGEYLGQFGLNQLPLDIADFPWNGLIFNHVKVCTGSAPACCKEYQFLAPSCLPFGPCEIGDIFLQTGPCTSDSTYKINLNFNATNPGNGTFTVSIHNQLLDTFSLSQVPLMLEVPWNGQGGDFVTICILGADTVPGTVGCCRIKQFQVPSCLVPCSIFDVVLDPGDCNQDGTYDLHLNFGVHNPGNDFFEVWGNGTYLGLFALDSLPLLIPNFPSNGNDIDVIKICINDNSDCCKTLDFQGPNCNNNCEIFDLAVDPGDCNSDGTYNLHLNFGVNNPGNAFFEVWGNGTYLGLFALDSLPLVIHNFPSNGNAIDIIKVCINDHPDCCKAIEFQGPNCDNNCEIFDLAVDPGDCNSDGTYNLHLNFGVNNPGNDFFEVWGNGTYLGLFALDSLPLVIHNFPSNGNPFDVIKVCINDQPDCCKVFEFQGPNCDNNCEIFDLAVDPGDCDPNAGTYNLVVNFGVVNPGNALFEVWGNGVYLGAFPLAGLPLTIPNFPSNGNALDEIKVCINDHPDCCKSIAFQGPNCDAPCEIFDLNVEVGDCHPADSTYTVWVNFQVQNPGSNTFGLWANGQFFGNYNLNQLPLQITNFPWDGTGPNDVIKVCITSNSGALSCCRTIEYAAPNCFPDDCAIHDLIVDTGDCTGDSSYQLKINFIVVNPPSDIFSVWANGQLLGLFNVNQLPLTIQNFPWNGGNFDGVKVCFTNNPGGPGSCCAELEFHVPDCLQAAPCDIFDLTVTPGDCDPNTETYPLTFDFEVANPGNDFFEVWVNGTFYGTHLLSTLPFTIPNVPSNGNAGDIIKVCINDQPDCCQILEFPGPACNNGGNCEIFDVVLDPGDCNPATNNFNLLLNFQVVNPGNNLFEVWGNGVYLGAFPLAGLPMMIQNFPSNGQAIDIIKICINDNPDCCKTLEFQGPNCGAGNCEIFDLVTDPGICTGDSSYQLKINFQVANPSSNVFRVWANGQVLGDFMLNQLPLLIPNFPWNGGNFDVIKVCLIPNVPNPIPCCIEREFQVPNCLGNGDCHIYDLQVLKTPCLCGQFFAVLTFQHENGGAGGFDIVGNGNNYGNYPYNTTQPIILGPFDGNGTTVYEFSVIDHDHPDQCGDEFVLGEVTCMNAVVDPGHGTAVLTLSPNPTANWLNVTALLENGASIGQANVEVYATDGRLVQTHTVANGANFQLEVANLPSGVYRLVLLADSGRLEGTFAKQ